MCEEDTLKMYQRLESEKKCLKLVSTINQNRKINPRYQIRAQYMEYYFHGPGTVTPYYHLRPNRDENGELILPALAGFEDEVTRYQNVIEKDQQYYRLAQAVKQLTDLPWKRMITRATKFAEENSLDFLQASDIKKCVSDIGCQAYYKQRCDNLRRFGYDIIDNSMKEIISANRRAFLTKAKRTYPLVLVDDFDELIDMVVGRKLSKRRAKQLVDDYCNSRLRRHQTRPTTLGDYIELKLRLAKRIGIIKETKEGFFVDAFSHALEK